MPVPLNETVEPDWKLLTNTVKLVIVCPCVAEVGEIDVICGGAAALTVKLATLLEMPVLLSTAQTW